MDEPRTNPHRDAKRTPVRKGLRRRGYRQEELRRRGEDSGGEGRGGKLREGLREDREEDGPYEGLGRSRKEKGTEGRIGEE